MIQIVGVYTTFCQEEGILLQKYAIEMGGVSRYFSKVSGSGVALTLVILRQEDGAFLSFSEEIPTVPLPLGTPNMGVFGTSSV